MCWDFPFLAHRFFFLAVLACNQTIFMPPWGIMRVRVAKIKREIGEIKSLRKQLRSYVIPYGIPWTEEPCGLQSTGSQRVGHDWVTSLRVCCSFLLKHNISFFCVTGHWVSVLMSTSKCPGVRQAGVKSLNQMRDVRQVGCLPSFLFPGLRNRMQSWANSYWVFLTGEVLL